MIESPNTNMHLRFKAAIRNSATRRVRRPLPNYRHGGMNGLSAVVHSFNDQICRPLGLRYITAFVLLKMLRHVEYARLVQMNLPAGRKSQHRRPSELCFVHLAAKDDGYEIIYERAAAGIDYCCTHPTPDRRFASSSRDSQSWLFKSEHIRCCPCTVLLPCGRMRKTHRLRSGSRTHVWQGT